MRCNAIVRSCSFFVKTVLPAGETVPPSGPETFVIAPPTLSLNEFHSVDAEFMLCILVPDFTLLHLGWEDFERVGILPKLLENCRSIQMLRRMISRSAMPSMVMILATQWGRAR